MISEILSISLQARQSGAVPRVAITADRQTYLQDLWNSRDVVLAEPDTWDEAEPGRRAA
jgi:hypothetical protein